MVPMVHLLRTDLHTKDLSQFITVGKPPIQTHQDAADAKAEFIERKLREQANPYLMTLPQDDPQPLYLEDQESPTAFHTKSLVDPSVVDRHGTSGTDGNKRTSPLSIEDTIRRSSLARGSRVVLMHRPRDSHKHGNTSHGQQTETF
jgi:hypothetical protein